MDSDIRTPRPREITGDMGQNQRIGHSFPSATLLNYSLFSRMKIPTWDHTTASMETPRCSSPNPANSILRLEI